ncbi:Putative uncharacterized protein [Cardinium endosymbiont cEper1 of Encarsia pergandiella]|uniref:DUF6048 family protein n=1 Tax=Cardinium endosymbiont of Encarsia pergandiella TaxID=249402 RepID=UPI00027E9CE1|nr:DUF6048 family protein [Cardinium endosymbiont of Encarsia pergandiella]CCM10004.1 Putative uncharacterized protein [Cardinium endosymbiont cEper1 of Encarsia pergandiella]
MLRYIIKPFLGLFLLAAVPQYIVAKDQLPPNRIWPTTCCLGIDLAKTCLGWYQKTGSAYEINGSIDFNRILLDLDYGIGTIQRDHRKDKGSLTFSRGYYFRIGLGYNFLTPTMDRNQFFIGFRYARSFFDFQLESNKLQCNHPSDKSCNEAKCTPPNGLSASLKKRQGAQIVHWWEWVVGGKVYLMPMLSIGCTARYKFNKKLEKPLATLPFDIPGFGLAEFDDVFGYSLYLLIRIPLQKTDKICHQNLAQKSTT